jgi:hypothetical protein
MRIRYRRAMVVAPLICAMVFFAFPLKDRLAFSIFMLNGVPLLAIAFALRFRSLGELTDRELILRALYGGKEARFPRGNLSVVDDKIYCWDKRVPIAKWNVDPEDWQALVRSLRPAQTAPP